MNIQPKLYRYSGRRNPAPQKTIMRKVISANLDLGFDISLTQLLSIKGKVPFDEDLIFDILKIGKPNRPVWKASLVTEDWSRSFQYKCFVKKIYDGDTITSSVVDLGFNTLLNSKIRLKGIDTPELRGSTKEEGRKSRDRLRELILDKEVFLQTDQDKKGKYGRCLGTIILDGVDINQQMIDEGFAVVY